MQIPPACRGDFFVPDCGNFFNLVNFIMRFEISVLGSSSALPTAKRNLTAQVVNLNEKMFLVDCGDGTQIHLRRNNLKFTRINHILISHLHGDHFFGLIGLLSSMQLLGRTKDMHIYCPPRLEKIINVQLEITNSDFSFPVHYHHLDHSGEQLLHEAGDFYIKSFPVEHRIESWGFLFAEKKMPRNIKKSFAENYEIPFDQFDKIKAGEDFTDDKGVLHKNRDITLDPPEPRSYAFCSDTRYAESIVPFIQGVDLLYHEATFAEDKKKEATEKYHSTARQAAEIAGKAGAGKLMIGHFSARYKSSKLLVEEAREVFPETYAAEDGKTYKIKQKRRRD